MSNSPITFVINGHTYRISLAHPETIRHIPAADRDQLLALLEAVKLQTQLSDQAVNAALVRANTLNKSSAKLSAEVENKPVERLGAGDIDAIAEKLMNEERKKPAPTVSPATLYKWMGAIIALIALLVWLT